MSFKKNLKARCEKCSYQKQFYNFLCVSMYGCGYLIYILNKILLTAEMLPPFIPFFDGLKKEAKKPSGGDMKINWSGKPSNFFFSYSVKV